MPGAAYPEKSGIYVNTEGRVQMETADLPPGEAREEWAIFRALSDVLGVKLPYDSLAALRQALFREHPHLARIGQVMPSGPSDVRQLSMAGGNVDKAPFTAAIEDSISPSIARASAIMGKCSALAEARTTMTAAE